MWCRDNDEDSGGWYLQVIFFMRQLVVLLCLSHENVDCWSVDGGGCRELCVSGLTRLEGAQLGFLWKAMDHDLCWLCRPCSYAGVQIQHWEKIQLLWALQRMDDEEKKIQLPLHGAVWCQSQCTWGSILKWKRLSLVSWLCWGSLCALSKMPAQQENVVGMGIWLMALLPYQLWRMSDRRQFHVGNAAVAVGGTAQSEE